MNVEELANGFVNAFSDMAKAASEFWEACNIVTDSIKKQVVSIQLAYIEKLRLVFLLAGTIPANCIRK